MPFDYPVPPVRFEEAEHRYFDSRGRVPGVTSVLESQGLITLGPDNEANAFARDLGKAVHLACELYDAGTLDPLSLAPMVSPYLDAWIRFRGDVDFVVDASELLVYEPTYRYAGRLDRIGSLRSSNKRLVREDVELDIKTGMPQRATGPQTAAYLNALPKSERKRKRYAVHLNTLGQYQLVAYDNPGDFGVFLSALTLHNWKGEGR